MTKYFLGIVSGIVITVLGMMCYDWITRIDANKVIAYLPYANDYFYSDGKTYKSASPSPENNMPRDIDPQDSIPLNMGQEEHKLTIGVKNINSKAVEDVRIFLELPEEFALTKWGPWQKYSEKNCSIGLGTINSGVGLNAVEPIFFKVSRPGAYKIIYIITGKNIAPPIKRIMTFIVYK